MDCQKLSFVVLLCLVVFACDAQKTGFKTTLSLGGIEYLKDIGMGILEKQLSTLALPDIDGNADTPVGHVTYSLTDITLTSLTIGECNVSLVPANSLTLTIQNTQASMTLNWHYREDSFPHVSDSGSADISISQTAISVEITLGESGGRPTATTASCSVNIGKLDITIHGGGSWFYNWFIGLFSGQIKSSTESALQNQIPQSINQGLASAFSSLPISEPINSKVEINYALQAPPTITPSYFSMAVEGEFYSIQSPQEAPFSPSALPDMITPEMVQMFVSDFTANSASFVFYSDNQMQYTLTDSQLPADAPLRLNTTYFTELIPPLQKAYPNQMFNLHIYATETPVASFSTKGASVVAIGGIDVVMLPQQVVAFTLGLKVLSSGTASLSGLNVTGHLTFINATISLSKTSIGNFDVSVLQSIIDDLVTQGLIPMGNKILQAGFPLPTVNGLTFINPSIGWGEGYLIVSTNVNYVPGETKEDVMSITVV